MAYEKQEFVDGQVLTADCLNRMEEGIQFACDAVPPGCDSKDCSTYLSHGANGLEWVPLPKFDTGLTPNLHVWSVQGDGGGYILGSTTSIMISHKGTIGVDDEWDNVTYADSIINESGTLRLIDSQTVLIEDAADAEVLKGKFAWVSTSVGNSVTQGMYYISESATFTANTEGTGVTTGYNVKAISVQKVTAQGEGSVAYVASENRNAYTDASKYVYLGRMGDAFNGGLPAYTEDDYGKFLSPSADGFQWAEPAALPAAEEASF